MGNKGNLGVRVIWRSGEGGGGEWDLGNEGDVGIRDMRMKEVWV